MLGSAAPATASLYIATTSATPTSPTRPTRLRGLSYLRSVTRDHLHHHSHSPRSEIPPSLERSTSSPGLVRSQTAAPAATNTASSAGTERGSQTIQRNGWIPTVEGRSGLTRESLRPTSTSTESAAPEPSSTTSMMTRSRAAGVLGPTPTTQSTQRRQSNVEGSTSSEPFAIPDASTSSIPGPGKDPLPTIRFIPHIEARSSRPSLQFSALSRTLKQKNNIVRVGRYSERDNNSGDATALPVGFKSKVVSRRHCEFWCTDGQWYIKDVKSSSGTFLNHVRLSSPGVESRPYPVNDGDVVQLGIDFKGGEEVIFRCVKIRVECNRGWQKSLNNFNTSAHKRLLKSAIQPKNRDSDAASVNSSECSICLNPVAPCQALFVAPCSHVWHYKCVRNLIHGPTWPNFLCPNCRFVADLDADVEQPEDEEWEIEDNTEQSLAQTDAQSPSSASSDDHSGLTQSDGGDEQRCAYPPRRGSISRDDEADEDLVDLLRHTTMTEGSLPIASREAASGRSSSSTTRPIKIAQPTPSRRIASDPVGARSTTPTSHAQFALAAGPIAEGPMTPRNDVGPFILDGSAGRADREDNNLVTQAVAEVSEPNSMQDHAARLRP